MRPHLALLVFGVLTALLVPTLLARAQSAPPNDDFAGYTFFGISALSPTFTDTTSTVGATLESGEPVCTEGGGATVWYVFYPDVPGEIVVDTAGSDFGTTVAVYRITDFAPSPPGGSLEEITCTGGPSSSRAEFTAQSGMGLYAIQIGGFNGESGTLRLNVSCERGCPPYNDAIALAPHVFEVPYRDEVRTVDATTEAGEPLPCGGIGRTVWQRIETSESAGHVIGVQATADFTPVIAVYKQSDESISPPPGALALLTCRVPEPGTRSLNVGFTTEAYTIYYVQTGGTNAAGGMVGITITCSTEVCRFVGDSPTPDTDGGHGLDDPGRGGSGTIVLPETGSGGYLADEAPKPQF